MTTRLIVKSLPSNCTEASLRKFFKKYGTLSDCTLKYTKEGKFRKFAFVGFDSEENAKKALQETNLSYMGSSRLHVEECKPFGDANKPRAWSQYAKDSSAYKRKHEVISPSQKVSKEENPDEAVVKKKKKTDPEYRNFLEAQGIKDDTPQKVTIPNSAADNEKLLKELMDGISGDTKLSLIFIGLPASIKQKNLKEWLSPVRVKAMKIVRNETAAAAFITFNRPPDVRRALQRDQEFIGGYKLTISKAALEEEVPEANNEDEDNAVSRETEEARIREELLETGRIFVRNLPFTTKEEDLHFLFKKFGEIAEIQVIIDKKTGNCKGFAIVEFVFPESAVAAYASADGTIFKGRMMHIIPGSEKREKKDPEKTESSEKTSYKKEKLKKLKANAAKSHSWNALFLGPNAIADTLAEKLGVEKGDLLNSEGGESAGVRLALAETRLVRETREFFLANGVCLDAFSRPAAKRSNTVIIAKNLPAGVEEEELQRMFGKFGEVDKVLMPPEGGISAIVVMNNVVDAKKAFQALAYSRFRTQPLYLEWAPVDVFSKTAVENKVDEAEENPTQSTEVESVKKKKNKREMTYEEKKAEKRKRREQDKEKVEKNVEEMQSTSDIDKDTAKKVVKTEEEDSNLPSEPSKDVEEHTDEDIIEPGSTVFVKNLSFDTTEESLDKLFRKKYRIKGVQISKKLNPADPSKSLSMGFGFVQFYTQEDAKQAIKELQGELLNGHCLELKISHRELTSNDALKRKAVSATKQGTCTKLLVRNIPFQASIKEIESLFASFGEIKSIRIPRKLGSGDQHRGFGFVDFISIGEAKRAFEALVHSTHVYGRRLVLEWAKSDDTVEELREKTAEKFSGGRVANRKQKKRMEAIEKDLAVIDDD
uniref:RNA-binding protein 19 n=1 Tax=Haemonchus contortus TaxID=6289 RepID=A0A7I4YHS9_HAECO